MPVSKHRRKQKPPKRIKTKSPNKQELKFFKQPFGQVPKEVLRSGLIELGKTKAAEFPRSLRALEERLQSSDPLTVISILSAYGLVQGIDAKGNLRPGYYAEEFNQSHVELTQALCLRTPFNQFSQKPPNPSAIQELFEELMEIANAFQFKRFAQLEAERSSEDHAVLLIQEELRLHTQVVRNWGFLSRVIRIVKRLCSPIDEIFETKLGITATNLIDLFHHLSQRQERLINDRYDRLSPMFQESTIEGVIKAFHTTHPNVKDTTAEMITYAEKGGVNSKQMKFLLLSYSDLLLASDYTFDTGTIATETNLDVASIGKTFDRLSLSFGDLADFDPERFFLANPVWTKPLIKLGNDTYFCAIPQMFFSFIFQIFSELLQGDEEASQRYESRRSEFLESEVAELFRKAFPGCEIETGYRWKEGAVVFENDLMIRVDSHLLIIEAKSQSVSWPALRGAPERARKHVTEMLLSPSVQSLRLASRVQEAISDPQKLDALLPNFPVALNQIKTVLRLSVTLEDFATIQTALHRVKETKWIPTDHPVAPCILLADLEIVFDILESTPQKIHYLKSRAEIEKNSQYKGDELDLLGVYLQTRFDFGDGELSEALFTFIGASKSIDKYYNAIENGVKATKPSMTLTPWWRDLCESLQSRGFHQWSDVANVLLSVPFNDQKLLAKKFKRLCKNVQKNWWDDDHNCAITLVPHKLKSDALAIFAFKERSKAERYVRMETIATKVFESSHVERCLVIAINIDKGDYPYSLVSVYFRGEIERHESES